MKVELPILYSKETKQYEILVNGKPTTNVELIGLEVMSKLKYKPKPTKNIQRFLK